MNITTKRWLFWSPRILGILFALFISMFALDVFGEGYGFPEVIVAFVMHMVPTALVVVALALAWRWEWIGTALFAGLGIFYQVMMRRDLDLIVVLLIPGPLFLLALLFWLNWQHRAELRT